MKKLVSLLLVMIMVLSLFTIVPFSAGAADTKTVYFQNNWMWTDVKVYYWGSSSTNSAAWPGDTPQLFGNDGTYDIYAATVPSDIEGIIFNGFDGGINSNNQTPDITDSANGDCYYMIWENQNKVGKMNIYDIIPQPDKPTDTPATQIPVTQAPVTQAPVTVAPTQPAVDGLFVKVGGELYEVNKGDTFTYNYYLSVDSSLKISSLDINMVYDTQGLDLVPFTDEYGDVDLAKHFPKLYGGIVHNFAIDGEIYYNYSNVAGTRLANDSLVFTAQFKVTADKGIYEIGEKIVTLADSDMNKIVYDNEVIQPGTFSVKTEADVPNMDDEPTIETAEVTENSTVEPTKPTETEKPTTSVVEDGVFIEMDGELYKVAKGDTVTYQYILNVPDGRKISSIDMNTFYDTDGLDFLPYTDEYGDDDILKHFPKINGGVVHNFGIDGELYYNYSNVAGIRLANDVVMFEGQFKVTADKGTYKIYTDLVTLADSDMNKIVYDHEVIQNIYNDKEILVGLTPYDPTEKPTETENPDEPEGLYIRIRDTYYKVEQGMEYTFTYYLQVEDVRIGSIDARVSYDADGLEFVPTMDEYGDLDLVTMFPTTKTAVFNYSVDGMLYFNYASATGVKFPEKESVLFTGKFKVTADEGVYDITPSMYCLADDDLGIIVDEGVVKGEYYDHGILEPQFVIGDVNRDGKINVFDATAIQRYAAEFIEFDDEQMIIADTNRDGNVNIFDASQIMRYIAGYITEF